MFSRVEKECIENKWVKSEQCPINLNPLLWKKENLDEMNAQTYWISLLNS